MCLYLYLYLYLFLFVPVFVSSNNATNGLKLSFMNNVEDDIGFGPAAIVVANATESHDNDVKGHKLMVHLVLESVLMHVNERYYHIFIKN